MATALKLTQIGNSVGVILPKEVLARLKLEKGDTVFVTRAETVFIEGQVSNPGVYVLEKGMTVLRLISVAGGTTSVGASNRARIRRIVNGQVTEIKAKLTDVVQPGDTVVVQIGRAHV